MNDVDEFFCHACKIQLPASSTYKTQAGTFHNTTVMQDGKVYDTIHEVYVLEPLTTRRALRDLAAMQLLRSGAVYVIQRYHHHPTGANLWHVSVADPHDGQAGVGNDTDPAEAILKAAAMAGLWKEPLVITSDHPKTDNKGRVTPETKLIQ